MSSIITRRDFLNGTALAIAAGLTPAAAGRRRSGALSAGTHRPARPACRLFRSRACLCPRRPAFRHRRRRRPKRATILSWSAAASAGSPRPSSIAAPPGRTRAFSSSTITTISAATPSATNSRPIGDFLIGYGGSQSIQSPKTLWSDTAKGLLRDLGVEVTRFDTAFDRGFYPSLGLSHGVFFDRETFGRDALVPGDVLLARDDKGRPAAARRASSPPCRLRMPARRNCCALYDATHDPLAGKSAEEKLQDPQAHELSRLPDQDLRLQRGGRRIASRAVRSASSGSAPMRWRPPTCATSTIRASPASACPRDEPAEWREPYIYHFPDGNASLARLLVRCAHSAASPAARRWTTSCSRGFDYDGLDRDDNKVRIRLDSTVIDVRQRRRASQRRLCPRRRAAPGRRRKHAVLACFHMMIPYLMPELPPEQRAALAQNVKTPLVYTNVRGAQLAGLAKLKVSRDRGADVVLQPTSRSISRSISAAIVIRAIRRSRWCCISSTCPARRIPGSMPAPSSASAGGKLLAMTFADFETRIRDQLDRMLGPGGFVERTRHRRDHRQSLGPRLRLCGEFAVRSRRLRGARAESGAAHRRPRRHRQFRRRRRCLCASRDRSGRPRRARTVAAMSARTRDAIKLSFRRHQ